MGRSFLQPFEHPLPRQLPGQILHRAARSWVDPGWSNLRQGCEHEGALPHARMGQLQLCCVEAELAVEDQI